MHHRDDIEILYEISLKVGTSLELEPMLRDAILTMLRLLNCSGAQVLRAMADDDAQVLQWRPMVAVPRPIGHSQAHLEFLAKVELPTGPVQWPTWASQLPIQWKDGHKTRLLFDLPGFGVLALEKNGDPFGVAFVRSLQELLHKLANASLACLDVIERRRIEEELRRRRLYEHLLLSDITTRAVNVEDVECFQQECLALVGNGLSVSRAYLCEYRQEIDAVFTTNQWHAQGIARREDPPNSTPGRRLHWLIDMLHTNNAVNHADIEDIPDPETRQYFREHRTKAVLAVPLFAGGRFFGWIGLDECVSPRHWLEEDQAILHSICRIIDGVGERKRAEAEREQLQAQLTQAQKMESVGRLAGGVAHDFNNMLSVILGRTELAQRFVDSTQPLGTHLAAIRKAAEHSAEVTRQLLAFARKQPVTPKVLDLNATVTSMLGMIRRLIGEHIDLAWHPDTQVLPVRIDPSQIHQILVNLCVNARDAIVDTGRITIETGFIVLDEAYCASHPGCVAGDYVQLSVSDDGCGMDKQTLVHVFEPFYTTKALGKGTGLGLAMIYGIVKQNRGFIDVSSETGQGTRFAIYLPPHRGTMDQCTERIDSDESIRGHRQTILLVEDDSAILELATLMLQELGYTVLSTESPAEAIQLIETHPGRINLLITDVVMPEMNGRDLAAHLRTLRPNLHCLFMSGYTADIIAKHGIVDEGVHFIRKPFTIHQLGTAVRRLLTSAPHR